jgi:3-methylcrotonyl-CoA carboxylase alpha subunit
VKAGNVERTWRVGREVHDVDLRFEPSRAGEGGTLAGTVNGASVTAEAARAGAEVSIAWAGSRATALVVRRGETLLVAWGGRTYELVPVERGTHAAGVHEAEGEPFATSPMTGVVVKVHVDAGAAVARGAALFVVEAMKMEYVVRAERDVVVEDVKRGPGERVEVGEVIVTFREGDEPGDDDEGGGGGGGGA